MSYRIGIIAALAGELKPLVRGWSRQTNGAFLTQRGDVAAIAVAKGMGAARAEASSGDRGDLWSPGRSGIDRLGGRSFLRNTAGNSL